MPRKYYIPHYFICAFAPSGISSYMAVVLFQTFCEELQQSVTCLGDKIKELERELKISNSKLTEALVQQKHLEMKLAEEKERTAKLVVDKNDLEKRIVVFPELTEVKNFERNGASIYSQPYLTPSGSFPIFFSYIYDVILIDYTKRNLIKLLFANVSSREFSSILYFGKLSSLEFKL